MIIKKSLRVFAIMTQLNHVDNESIVFMNQILQGLVGLHGLQQMEQNTIRKPN